MKKITFIVLFGLLNNFGILFAEEEVEEVVVTGSQIKGAKITGVLPVTILSSDILMQLVQKTEQSLWKI